MRKILAREGEEKVVRKFLFFPLTLLNEHGDYETRWLELANVRMRYYGFVWYKKHWEDNRPAGDECP